jgi:general secretion pathway protein F
MPVYQYRGFASDGNAAAGIIDAESPKGARTKLRRVGVYPTEVMEQGSASQAGGLLSAGAPRRSAALTGQDLAILTRQLGTLLVAGLPLVDALGVLIDQVEKKAEQTLLADLRDQIRGGKAFSAALETHPADFSQVYLHMVQAGEASGALDRVLFRLAEFLENQQALRGKVVSALTYPVLMLGVAVAILFFLLGFVVPKITAVFHEMKQALPWPTLLLIRTSDVVATTWPVLLAGLVALAVAIKRLLAHPNARLVADGLLLRAPFLGHVAQLVAVSRFCSTLATMLASGVQLLDALDIAKRVMNNRVLERAVDEARQQIREGESFAAPLKRSGLFPPLVVHMITVGEKSGELEEMLRRVSQIYDGEVDRVVTRVTSLLEPVMILGMGLIVFFIVLAILLPIFEMSQFAR